MSIDVSSEEGDGEDDFGDAIHMVHGLQPPKKKTKKEKEREKEREEKREERKEDKEREETREKGTGV